MRAFRLLSAVVLVGLATPSLAARADTTAAAAAATASEALIEQGLALRERKMDEEAIPIFARAFALDPNPRARAQLALAQQGAGRWIEAEAGLTLALAADADPWIARNRALLEQALAIVRQHAGWLDVETAPVAARVTLDGVAQELPTSHASLRLPTGAVRVGAEAAGYACEPRVVDVRAGETARVALILTPISRPVAAAPPPGIDPLPPAGATARAETRPKTLAWVSLAGAGALLAGGAVATAVREHDVAIWNDDARCRYGSETRQQRCGSYATTGDVATALAIAGYVAGGALAVTAVVSFATGGEPRRDRATAGARCGVGMISVWCAASF